MLEKMDEEIINLKECHCYVLRDQECYFNWVVKEFDIIKAKERMASRGCIEACSDISECKFCCFEGKWRNYVEPTHFLDGEDDETFNRDKGHIHKFVSWNGEMTFLETFIGEYEQAEKRLDYLNSVINDRIGGQDRRLDYLDGYKYIREMLGAYIQFCKLSLSRSDRASLPSFNQLSTPAQIGVLSLKFLFCKETKESFEAQIQILRKLIELDPLNAIWHESLGLRLRLVKNDAVRLGRKTVKWCSPEQSTAFATAYSLRPDIPRFFASFSRNVAESWKNCGYQSQTQPITLSIQNQSFDTVEDALNFLKRNTRFLLEVVDDIASKADTARSLSSLGEVFSVSLPIRLRDLELAEECIKVAIRLNPSCSKSNHRMGLFQFFKRRNFDSGLSYLVSAVGSKTENFYAVVDWIQLLIYKGEMKSETLREIFENILSTDFKWTAVQTARLTFLKGCFNFIVKGNKEETMDSWIQAYNLDAETLHFSMAFHEAKRFQWKCFDVKDILTVLTSSKLKADPIVKKMVNEIRARGAALKENFQFNDAKSKQK
ncbi:uncharacterized protein LOC119083667 [Bradysia coprophila]|uniref:uncharacterized protein LOC119083667 n=1 Tax=Bradysia coprophila TaxID=38358 RepID=UPI00187D90A7|nr:uncharacterized protein LOC119083667 [Bradysia coprophila]